MANGITEKGIQEYESILEQSKLEAYLRYHLAPTKDKEEEEGESREANSGNAEAEAEDAIESEDGASWSANELDLFFISLERHGRVRCDLIAEDLGGCKSISQIAHLIHLFEQEKDNQEKHKAKMNFIRRMKDTPIAIEVSKEWEQIEETIASKLQHWEEIKHQKLGDGKSAPNVDCDWDMQVMYSILFLRHSSHLDPLQNAANLVVEQASSSLTEESSIFSFTISDVVDILHDSRLANKLDTRAFWSFAKDHCVPNIESDKIAWQIILRSIQLEYLVPINATGEKMKVHDQDRASLDEESDFVSEMTVELIQESPKQRLVWWDSLSNTKDVEALTKRLDDTRELALHQLLRSLKRREWRQVMAMIYVKTHKEEKEGNSGTKHHLAEDDANENSPSKRRKITPAEGAVIAGKDKWGERMVRFDRIGIHEDDLLYFLEPHFNFEEQSLFHTKGIAHQLKHNSSLGGRISLHIFDFFAVCLRIFLHRIFEHITNQISHSLRPDYKQFVAEITKDDIVKAIAVVIRSNKVHSELSKFDVFDPALADESIDTYQRRSNQLLGLKKIMTMENYTDSAKQSDRPKASEEVRPRATEEVRPKTSKKVRIKSKGEIKTRFIKEIKEIIRLEGVGKEDRKRSKMAEQLLWSRLGLSVPDILSYNGTDEDETDEEEGEEESENESSSSSSGSEWSLH